MSTLLPSISIASRAKPRKRERTLPCIALVLATLASAGLFNAAHATYPGENGVIVFEQSDPPSTIAKVTSEFGNKTVTPLGTGTQPSVSPSGKKIAYLSSNRLRLYVMNTDGSNVVEIMRYGRKIASPAWSPDGAKIAYATTSTNGSAKDLRTIKPDGTGNQFVRSLPSAVPIDRFSIAWSPSGNIYTFNADGANDGGDKLYIADNINPSVRALADSDYGSSWAPDGASILFNVRESEYEINPDGSNTRGLKPLGETSGISSISPDGQHIAGSVDTTNGIDERVHGLAVRQRAGGWPLIRAWNAYSVKTDWSRVPKNCELSTPSTLQGGEVLAGDEDFYATQCAIAVMPDGGLNGAVLKQVIAIGPDQRLYHRLQKATPPIGALVWTPFLQVPGIGGNPNGINPKKIAIAAANDGSVQLVIINAADDLVYHAMRYIDGSWSGFNLLNGWAGAPNFAARDVAIAIGSSTLTSPGNAQVIVNGLVDGNVFHRVRWPDTTWTRFAGVPGLYANRQTSHALAITVGADGNADVIATLEGSNGIPQLVHQNRYADGTWDGNWVTVGTPAGTTLSASSDVAVTRTFSGTAQLMFTDSKNNAYFQERPTPNDPSSWSKEIPSPQIAKTVGRAVSISAAAINGPGSHLLLTRTFPQ